MVWIQPRIIDHNVAKKEKENNLWTAECVNERFLLESLTVKPLRNPNSRYPKKDNKKNTRKETKEVRRMATSGSLARFIDNNIRWPRDDKKEPEDEVEDIELGELDEEMGIGERQREQRAGTKLWRIVMLRTDEHSETVVVAEDDAEESIRENWRWIEANVLSKLSQIISEEGTEKVDKFLLLQFQVLPIAPF